MITIETNVFGTQDVKLESSLDPDLDTPIPAVVFKQLQEATEEPWEDIVEDAVDIIGWRGKEVYVMDAGEVNFPLINTTLDFELGIILDGKQQTLQVIAVPDLISSLEEGGDLGFSAPVTIAEIRNVELD